MVEIRTRSVAPSIEITAEALFAAIEHIEKRVDRAYHGGVPGIVRYDVYAVGVRFRWKF
jgi:hypothetical protein